jgi:hypothetical protein
MITTSREQDRAPTVSFYVRDLENLNTGSGDHQTKSWSQNDYTDSIALLVQNLEGVTLPSVTIDLSGTVRVEGDANIKLQQRTSKTVRWFSAQRINVDSLPLTAGGRRLLGLRPSSLIREFKALAGTNMVVDSIHAVLQLPDGRTLVNGLALLWD